MAGVEADGGDIERSLRKLRCGFDSHLSHSAT